MSFEAYAITGKIGLDEAPGVAATKRLTTAVGAMASSVSKTKMVIPVPKTEPAVAAVKAAGKQIEESAKDSADKAGKSYKDMLKELGSGLGKKSALGLTLKLAMGGGAIGGLTMAGSFLADMTQKLIDMRTGAHELQGNAADKMLAVMKAAPMIGGFSQAGENINDLFGGMVDKRGEGIKTAVESNKKYIEAMNADLEVSVKLARDFGRAMEDSANFRQGIIGEGRSLQASLNDSPTRSAFIQNATNSNHAILDQEKVIIKAADDLYEEYDKKIASKKALGFDAIGIKGVEDERDKKIADMYTDFGLTNAEMIKNKNLRDKMINKQSPQAAMGRSLDTLIANFQNFSFNDSPLVRGLKSQLAELEKLKDVNPQDIAALRSKIKRAGLEEDAVNAQQSYDAVHNELEDFDRTPYGRRKRDVQRQIEKGRIDQQSASSIINELNMLEAKSNAQAAMNAGERYKYNLDRMTFTGQEEGMDKDTFARQSFRGQMDYYGELSKTFASERKDVPALVGNRHFETIATNNNSPTAQMQKLIDTAQKQLRDADETLGVTKQIRDKAQAAVLQPVTIGG